MSNSTNTDDSPLADEIIPASNLRDPSRRIWIVTTAALPWRTGTAVNPLLRALGLTQGRPPQYVTLVIPWLDDRKSRIQLYGKDSCFENAEEQEAWIRDYCRTRANSVQEEANLGILFYPAAYQQTFGSIFPTVDICGLIPDDQADIAILEEPEHLNWFRVPKQEESDESQDDGTSESYNDTDEEMPQRIKNELGWAYKFRHAVGILHTNYTAYMRDYAMGTSLIAAPALGLLSSLVVRAYCHQVIRLSDVLPSLAPKKEVTCNVHGVRSEFLDRSQAITAAAEKESHGNKPHSAVYFIGKLIWAKGFDKVLEMQDLYRKQTGEYFPMDVYGGGSDEKAISRAFLGRRRNDEDRSSLTESSPDDLKAAAIFDCAANLRRQISESDDVDMDPPAAVDQCNPFAIIGALSGISLSTGFATSKAAYAIGDNAVQTGMEMHFSEEDAEDVDEKEGGTDTGTSVDDNESENESKKSYIFDPPKSRYEWRLHAIPARFLGVRDHVEMRDIPDHKIFLNMSTTEVLCTTTAEALAMGKFAVIPNHSSNRFFLQFPNCLAYDSMNECVDRLKWALVNDPEPLSQEDKHKFTWEGANERLFKWSAITKKEAQKRADSGQDKADREAARLHVGTTKTGNKVHSFIDGIDVLG